MQKERCAKIQEEIEEIEEMRVYPYPPTYDDDLAEAEENLIVCQQKVKFLLRAKLRR